MKSCLSFCKCYSESDDTETSDPSTEQSQLHLIRDQMNFYFSPSNLETDKYLNGLINQNSERWINVSSFHNFKRLVQLNSTPELILTACQMLPDLEVNMRTKCIRTRKPFIPDPERRKRVIRIKGLKTNETLHSLNQWLNPIFGKVNRIDMKSVIKEGKKCFLGEIYVELESNEQARIAVARGIEYFDEIIHPTLLSDGPKKDTKIPQKKKKYKPNH